MANLRKFAAIVSAIALVATGGNTCAQDDLDALLQDLEGDSTAEKAKTEDSAAGKTANEASAVTPSETPAAETEEKVEEPVAVAAEDKAEETAEAEEKTEEVAEAEEKAEEPAEAATEEKTEEPAAVAKTEAKEATPVAETKTQEQKTNEVLNLLDDLAAEESAGEEETKVAAADKKGDEEKQVAAPATEVAKEEPKKEAYTGPDAELMANIVNTERIRRKAFDLQAKRIIEDARSAMRSGDYRDASKNYANALRLLNDSPKAANWRKECEQGIAESLYRWAIEEYEMGRIERGLKLLDKSIDFRHPKARKLREAWVAKNSEDSARVDISDISHRRNDASYKEKRQKINRHLKRARQLFAVRDLDNALDQCELVLVSDPYNQEAIKLRHAIQKKRHVILMQEREATREGMIADVDEAWRPVYAVNAQEIKEKSSETLRNKVDGDPERTVEQNILRRMKEMKLPQISFKPPATIIDAVEFFRTASKDYDRPDIPIEQRGFNFVLKMPEALKSTGAAAQPADDEGFGAADANAAAETSADGVPVIPMITASEISFFDALKLVCDSVEYKFKVAGPIVMIMHKNMSTDEMVSRSYPVLSSFMDKMGTASSDMKEMRSGGFGGGNNSNAEAEDSGNQEKDWKEFFSLLGVQWPEGSTIMYIKAIGKLRVKNTYENLAELEKALTEMNADPKLIEIETRFVEVCQDDLNSLGFEWILNNNYAVGVNKHLARALGMKRGSFGGVESTGGTGSGGTDSPGNPSGGDPTTVGGTTTSSGPIKPTYGTVTSTSDNWTRNSASSTYAGVSKFGGDADYGNGNRYLSTLGNHISGESKSTNDQFMRVNAFLGNADLSMILHMLSQRSDTDLLSAPKVLTRPGEEAVIKVVTEYIYPTDYDVQLQSSSSGSSGSSGSSQSAILAVVEPQSFTMREVGVILDVTPTLTDDGNLIDLQLNTQVVDEPTWKNYGMRIPFTGNSSMQSFAGIGDIMTGLSSVLSQLGTGLSETQKALFAEQATSAATSALENLSKSSSDNITYYDAPMEQPFFHVRSIDSKVSVYPGSTIVMGGLITEARKAMDDKVPFLGDIPFIGRLFRSHAEQTTKRNLLIFVTTRLVDVRGREVAIASYGNEDETPVKAAPEVAAEK